MPFTGIAYPEQLSVLTEALQRHCAEFGIERKSPAYYNAGRLAVILFESGVTTPDALVASLRRNATRSNPEREQDRPSL